ncbi:MAG: CvpA family protein [Planctomycetaceae bacterium]
MWYDILVACILLFFMAKGAARGLIWQLAGIAGILLCVTFAGTASKVIGPHINLAPPTNQWAVMFITYLLATFVAFGFARTLNGWINQLELKEFNRHLGAVFGLLKGALLVLVMTFMIVTFSAKSRDMLKDSKSAQIAAKVIYQIEPLVPDKLSTQIAKYIDMFEQTGFGKNSVQVEDEALPPDANSPWDTQAPVSEDTTLGKSEQFNLSDWLPSSTQGATGSQGSGQSSSGEATDLSTELINTVGAKVTRMLQNELQSATPEQKAQILQNLNDALQSANGRDKTVLQKRLLNEGDTSSLVQLFGDWALETISNGEVIPGPPAKNSTPVSRSTTQPAAKAPSQAQTPTQPTNGKRTLLDQIVATKSDFTTIQNRLKDDYSKILEELPRQVSQNVLQDWWGDIQGTGADIDPGTNANTRIEERIIRQLNAQGKTEAGLSKALQDRLQQFRLSVEGAGVLR